MPETNPTSEAISIINWMRDSFFAQVADDNPVKKFDHLHGSMNFMKGSKDNGIYKTAGITIKGAAQCVWY